MKVRTRLRASSLLATFALLAAAALPVAAKELSSSKIRSKGNKARNAWRDGDIRQALALYDEILGATDGRAVPERGDALHAFLVVSLLPESPHHDPGRAQALLGEYLQSFSNHRRYQEVAVLHHLVESRSAEAERAEKKGARAQALESERQKLQEASGEHEAELQSLRRQLAETNEKLAAANGALKSAKEELAKKDEALEKLTRRVVGRAGDG